MHMKSTITINKPATDIWKTLVDDFDKVHDWMVSIKSTEKMTEGQAVPGAPMIGRIAAIGVGAPGSFLDETITKVDNNEMLLVVDTQLRSVSKGMPLRGYTCEIVVDQVSETESEVSWSTSAHIRLFGYLLYPAIKKGLDAGMYRSLEELKHYVETGMQHPRGAKEK